MSLWVCGPGHLTGTVIRLFPANSSLTPAEELCLVSDGFLGEVYWDRDPLSDHLLGTGV